MDIDLLLELYELCQQIVNNPGNLKDRHADGDETNVKKERKRARKKEIIYFVSAPFFMTLTYLCVVM